MNKSLLNRGGVVMALLILAACSGEQQTAVEDQKDTVDKQPVTQVIKQESTAVHRDGALPDLREIRDVKTKKRMFFDALRPMVVEENIRIAAQREQLLLLQQKKDFSSAELQWLSSITREYRTTWSDGDALPWQQLLQRIDMVPLELVLSQAANESSWGTSRFAREGNNLFGQWCFSKGCGLVPNRRNAGATHEVASFDSPQASVRAYMRNLNSGRVYGDLRSIRASERASGSMATAMQLAEGLIKYSERGHEYVKEIQAMIRVNGSLMRGES